MSAITNALGKTKQSKINKLTSLHLEAVGKEGKVVTG